MSTRHLPTGMLFTGILGVAIGGCNGSGNGTTGAGNSTDVGQTSGGASTSASKGNSMTDGGEDTGQSATGGKSSSGGSRTTASGGAKNSEGTRDAQESGGTDQGRGGSSASGSAKTSSSGGKIGSSAASSGGSSTGTNGSGKGGTAQVNTPAGGASGSKSSTGGATGATTTRSTTSSTNTGSCTASQSANRNVSGSGPHKVTVETNSDPGIKEGTIYRPTDLGGDEKYPIFVWGEGGCSLNGLSNSTAMAEIASHGYFVVADGTPGGSSSRSMDSSNPTAMGKPLLEYIAWAIAENDKPCSAYYQSLDTTKVASNGFSCGGLMAEGTAGDPRLTTWGITSSGMFGANQALYASIHTPVLIILGGPSDIAYENGLNDYENINDVPVLLFSKDIGHGGDLGRANGGDFTKINLAWLNWWLKGDETATGKGLLVGSGCTYCKDSAWEVKSKNIP